MMDEILCLFNDNVLGSCCPGFGKKKRKKKEVGKGDLPMPDASCCGVEARKRYMPRITSAKRKAILEIVPYCVLKNPSAPSLMASDI
jgi:hypothetical protein